MEERTVYEDLSLRTAGAVLVGVTGPTRTGKSTFVKRFLEELVLPNITDEYRAERARDELPQSGSGRTVMTSEPKFIPEEAVSVSPDGVSRLSVRLIDSVGYMIPGVMGTEEDGQPRMVTTPWFDHEIPITEAAEIGTKKVMEDHCTVGVVVTTDGTVTEIPRENYTEAEDRAIRDMKATGKPFVVVVNSMDPEGEEARSLCRRIRENYGVTAMAADCQTMDEAEIRRILAGALSEFPVTEIRFYLPGWMSAMACDHPVKAALLEAMRQSAERIGKICEAEPAISEFLRTEALEDCTVEDVDLGSGVVSCELRFPEALFYQILTEQTGFDVESDGDLMSLLTSLSQIKNAYDKVEHALDQAQSTGYGIVMPTPEEVRLEIPQIVRKGGNYAIKLKASAPSIHLKRNKEKERRSGQPFGCPLLR